MSTLSDHRTADGSRHFASVPQPWPFEVFLVHLELLRGLNVTGFLSDHVVECWIDFTYLGHSFTANNQFGEFWLLVKDPACPDAVLEQVLLHALTVPRNAPIPDRIFESLREMPFRSTLERRRVRWTRRALAATTIAVLLALLSWWITA